MRVPLQILRPLCRPPRAQALALPGHVLWLSCVCAYSFGNDGLGQGFSNYYQGAIGKYPIQLELTVEDGKASGHYFYESIGKPISLKGTLSEDGTLLLEESVDKALRARY